MVVLAGERPLRALLAEHVELLRLELSPPLLLGLLDLRHGDSLPDRLGPAAPPIRLSAPRRPPRPARPRDRDDPRTGTARPRASPPSPRRAARPPGRAARSSPPQDPRPLRARSRSSRRRTRRGSPSPPSPWARSSAPPA